MVFLWRLLLGLCLLTQILGEEMIHNLPDNLEIVDPKSLGLAGTDLDKFLGNVKLLPITGNGLLPKDSRTKTQILTVGFEGDEGLNLDDFELPSVDGLPDAEKTVAKAAFSRFQEFFKNPNKSKTIVDDEDLIEETGGGGELKRILTTTPTPKTSTTTTSTTTTTAAPSQTSSFFGSTFRRPVYRPRTPVPYTAPTTTSKPFVSRTRKFKRPGTFRRTTTTTTSTTPVPITPATASPSSSSSSSPPPQEEQERTSRVPSFYNKYRGDKKPVEFKPEQFQDYASIIRDLQGAGPRGPPAPEGAAEGAPNGLLGFQAVHEPGHSGPPIFEFGGSNDQKVAKPVARRPPISSTLTTEHQAIDLSQQQHAHNNKGFQQNDNNNPQQQFNNQGRNVAVREQVNHFFNNNNNNNQDNDQNRFSQQLINNNKNQHQSVPQQFQPSGSVKTFEQISAEPVGTVHVESTKVPYVPFPPQPQQQQQQQLQQQPLIQPNPQQQQFHVEQPLVHRNPQHFIQSPIPQPQQQKQQHQIQQQQILNSPFQQPLLHQQQKSQVPFAFQQQVHASLQPQQQLQFVQEQFQRQQQQQQQLRNPPQHFQEQQQHLSLPRHPITQTPPPTFQQNPIPQQPNLPYRQQQQQQHQQQHQQNQQQQQEQQKQQRPSFVHFPPPPPPQPQQQQFRQLNENAVNSQNGGRIAQPPLILNQNFLRPNINEKFFSPADTPKHVVRNPINLFGQNVGGAKPPQIFPLSTIENVVPPNFSPNRFPLPQTPRVQQQQQHHHHLQQSPSTIVNQFANPHEQFGLRLVSKMSESIAAAAASQPEVIFDNDRVEANQYAKLLGY